ncbi:MAG: Lipoprotein-releasing system ATP-binding protein LolD, partial [Verrucomicrobiota bacterium]
MVTCTHVRREFRGPQGNVRGLDDFSLSVDRGEFVVVQGASGSGKSTLLLTLGGMLRPDSGTVTVDGTDLYALDAAERSRLRARSIGFVFQLFHLVPYLTVRENV